MGDNNYDVTADGQRFLVNTAVDSSSTEVVSKIAKFALRANLQFTHQQSFGFRPHRKLVTAGIREVKSPAAGE